MLQFADQTEQLHVRVENLKRTKKTNKPDQCWIKWVSNEMRNTETTERSEDN